jgi:hypothetical protein
MLAGVLFAREQKAEARKGSEHAIFKPPNFTHFLFYTALVALVVEVFPLLYPAICNEQAFPTIQTVHHYEADTGLVGVDPEGSYFPVTVEQRPETSPLVADYEARGEIRRWDTAVLPEGATVIEAGYDYLAATLHLSTPEPFTARFLTFAFPGWTAVVDDEPVSIAPSDPEGLITFAVPAGEHTVAVRWQSTPLRTVLLGLSVMALAGAVMTAVLLRIEQGSGRAGEQGSRGAEGKQLWVLVMLGVSLLAFKVFVVDGVSRESVFRRPFVPDLAVQTSLRGNELQLLGYNLSQTQVASGGTFDVDMAWTAVAAPQTNYQTNVWLVDDEGLVWSDKETHRPRLYEDAPGTQFWQPGQWAWDSREVAIFSGTPPGEYSLVMTLFEQTTLQPVTLVDADSDAVVGPTAVLGQITITSPRTEAEFKPQYRLETAVGSAYLLGYNQDRQEAVPGEPILLTFFWQQSAEEKISLSLRQGNEVVQEWNVELPNGRYRSQHILRLPASLASGDYTFVLNGTITLGSLRINAPERLFEQPIMSTSINTTLVTLDGTPQATLVGYTIPNSQSPNLSISLVWQANVEMTTSYRVFVHVVDERGQIVAQADGEPVNWTRPTTGWAIGEYIVDEYQLSLPIELTKETLLLRVGLYNAETGERLQTETDDFVTILPLRP